ncbi:oxidoreductase [Nocardioides rubriscoriae]|uniref:oxidoreductase n=1 Tax=Nocardioides rubriscoriae TaxID=642762 RepID=UPI0011DF1ECB|nr:oxidoreductase [Nocardioides rubriscoriae]
MARAGRAGPWSAVPGQDGRRFVVTGANSGVGLETARTLAQRGAHVVLACRNADKGAAAARDIGRVDGSVEVRVLDVSDLSSVRRFADEVGAVDVLVNNAGILGVPFTRSVDGVELQLATNHLGHFALANLLLPRLTDRVVVVSSQSHRHGDLRLDDLDWQQRGYSPYGAYGASKLATMLFLAELQRRLTAAGSTLRATGAHPGSTATSITSSSGDGWFAWVGSWGHGLVGMKPAQGALPTLYAATMDVPGNTYVGPHRLREMNGWPTGVGRSRAALDPDLAKALWVRSEELSGVTWPL